MQRILVLVLVVALPLVLGACDGDGGGTTPAADVVSGADTSAQPDTPAAPSRFQGQHAHTMLLGANDNAEVVKALPSGDRAILVSSKARKVVLVSVTGGEVSTVRERTLFENDPTESELTHIDIADDGTWAVLTRTIIETDGSGAQTKCGGELVFIDAKDADSFGDVLGQVEVGPMPDSVDISDDGAWVVSANERDGPDAWGKCEVPGAKASISVIGVTSGPSSAVEMHRIEMVDGTTGPREPESIVFSADNDLVACTLQDSHEVVLFRVSALATVADPTSADVQIVALPVNALGAGPWPDGVARFVDGSGVEYFATAGEWNDTFSILNADGTVVATYDVSASDIPGKFPRVVEEGYPLFSPDSIASFSYGGKSYLAFTLRHAGAVAIYDVTDPMVATYSSAVQVGHDEKGGQDEDGSTIRPEGVAAAPDGHFLLTANEEESSVSLVLPVE